MQIHLKLAAIATTGVLTIALGGNSVAEEPAAPDGTSASKTVTAADQPQTAAEAASDDAWRFRQHQGLWWYWLPSEKWVYWSDGQWVDYDPQRYAELYNARRARRFSFDSGNARMRGGNSGNPNGYPELEYRMWGRPRYDSYGNIQYPYSQRRTGVRQLGPVPAMGGVRSLPGWGGER